jgi:hypothetical protein
MWPVRSWAAACLNPPGSSMFVEREGVARHPTCLWPGRPGKNGPNAGQPLSLQAAHEPGCTQNGWRSCTRFAWVRRRSRRAGLRPALRGAAWPRVGFGAGVGSGQDVRGPIPDGTGEPSAFRTSALRRRFMAPVHIHSSEVRPFQEPNIEHRTSKSEHPTRGIVERAMFDVGCSALRRFMVPLRIKPLDGAATDNPSPLPLGPASGADGSDLDRRSRHGGRRRRHLPTFPAGCH